MLAGTATGFEKTTNSNYRALLSCASSSLQMTLAVVGSVPLMLVSSHEQELRVASVRSPLDI